MSGGGYACAELLVEPEWLAARVDAPELRIVDCDGSDGYDRAHLPRAVSLPAQVLKDREDGVSPIPPAEFTELVDRAGISDEQTVIAYADGCRNAARLWLVLTYYGHDDTRVLNGGWRRWLDECRPVTYQAETPAPGSFTARPDDTLLCTREELEARLGDPGVQVLDVRRREWWEGLEDPSDNRRVGHIPGSVNIDADLFFEADSDVFRPAAELEALLVDAGLARDHEVVVHCQDGMRTGVGVFVLKLLGWERVRAYDASMAEWANRDDTPLVVGREPAPA